MNEQYYSIEADPSVRKILLEANVQAIELLKKYDTIENIRLQKSTQLQKLRLSLNSIKKNADVITKELPPLPKRITQPAQPKPITTKKELPITNEDKELSELEKEIIELRKKIDQL